MKLLITGATGFIGKPLCAHLHNHGHAITILSRNPGRVPPPATAVIHLSELPPETVFDAVINLASEPIANKRWNDRQKHQLVDSRLNTTRNLVSYFGTAATKPRVFISSSAVGFYGLNPTNEQTDQNHAGDDSFCSELCQQWEAAALEAESMGIRTCLLRTGVVLGRSGGALGKMVPSFKLGLGGAIGSGKQWMSWIHRDDLIGIVMHCLTDENLRGAINATAPHPVTNREFARDLGLALRRPANFPVPAFLVKLLFGQMGEELLLAGQYVLPHNVSRTGYVFQFEYLADALAELVG